MSLSVLSLQMQFQQHLLGAGDVTPLIAGDAARRQLGLRIYANAYRQRLLETLVDSYEKTQAVMGEAAFETAALAYIAAHPPVTRSLRWYGDGFADFLAAGRCEPVGCAEVAHLDWALRTAFDGPDADPLDPAVLADLAPQAWATVRLVPVPTLQLLVCRHNTVAVWQALDDDLTPPALHDAAVDVDWVVWRKGLQPHFRSLHRVEASLLRSMRDGSTFAQACAQAEETAAADASSGDEVSVLIGSFLRHWLDDRLLSRVVV